MSESTNKFEQFGFDRDPFATTIADEQIAAQYSLVGRDDQEYRLREFVRDGLRDPDRMKRRLIFGEYGTGKSHHLIELRDEVREGITIHDTTHDSIGVYVGNLGLSIRRLYERIVEEIGDGAPELTDFIESLPGVEPETSVDEAYKYEKLQDNVAKNLRRIIVKAREEHGYRAVFLFIDEAEDIATETDTEKLQRFVRSFLHLVNELNTSGLHILLGFSQGARMAITEYEDNEDTIGNALVQRFQGDDIYLGDLTVDDVKEMLIDRMDVHRTTDTGSLTPIVEGTVDVVTRVTNGHPRSVLRVYSEALNYAAEVDADRIDGEAIVYALTGFTSLVRDEELLSQAALNDLKRALEEAHPEARSDFERLEGRLIGQAESVPEDAFSDGVPSELTAPITVPDDDIGELRVLEQRDRHGRYSYVLSEEAQAFLFRGQTEEGTEIQKLDMRASNAPQKYQRTLSRGLGQALLQNGNGSLHKEPVTEPAGRYEFALHLIDISRGEGKGDQTVALGVYNGQEIPEELVRAYVTALSDRGASFGVLVKQNQQLSAEANRYLNELDTQTKQTYRNRVVEIDVSTDQRDEFLYGRLLALGDPETDVGDSVTPEQLVASLGVVDVLIDEFEEQVLPYPDSLLREVIDHLEANHDTSHTISSLRDKLDLKDYQLDSDVMAGLQAQSLVAKDGRRWRYPDVEDDRPPWYEVYRLIREEDDREGLTVPEIQSQLAEEYAFECAQGDENAMLQWYLDQLQRQNYVESKSATRDGKTVDVYVTVSVEQQYNEALSRAAERLEAAESLLQAALDLNADDVNRHRNRLDDFEKTLEDHKEVFDPSHGDLNDVRSLIDSIVELEEDIEETVSDRRDQILGDAKEIRDITIESVQRDIAEADVEGALQSDLQEYETSLNELHTELAELIENERYERLLSRTGAIRDEVEAIEDNIEEIVGLKGRCTEKFSELSDLRERTESHLDDIAQENETRTELVGRLDEIKSTFSEYESQFNDGKYETALDTLETEVEPKLKELNQETGEVAREQKKYLSRIEDLESGIASEEGRQLAKEARETTRRGNFAKAPKLIEDLKDLISGPTRREKFVMALEESEGNLSRLLSGSDFGEQEAFNYLRQTYGDEVTEIEVTLE
jgi:hypothetical protein